jgi:glycosidase
LPFGDVERYNVVRQRSDPGSVLNLTRDLIALRTSTPLGRGAYRTVSCRDGVWVWQRGDDLLVAANLTPDRGDVPVQDVEVLIGTTRERDGSRVRGTLRLEPWEGLVLASR